ncbi:hypothetical protein FNF27_06884 [Cafeteria roenbergensis]|uniref:Rad51-like C-terminal domain-containing protein n=1 Tax=Cafeteria roenbergensis TaxID=33653 RepID=A0A5A8DW39_CAFRO|nr:hypothetical protein FNF27_06884 [Cafeteria roenbergensis]
MEICWLTEIAGEAGAGKTQLVMQFAIRCAMPVSLGGMGAPAAIICTEGSFPVRRMRTMAFAVWAALSAAQRSECEACGVGRDTLWDCHLVRNADSPESLVAAVAAAAACARAGRCAALLLDSIAGPFRVPDPDEGSGGAASKAAPGSAGGGGGGRRWFAGRAKALLGVSSVLRCVALERRLPVLVANQATAVLRPDDSTAAPDDVAPALGMAWAHAAHVRAMLLRRRGSANPQARAVRVVFHPAAASSACVCVLGEAGLGEAVLGEAP